MISPKFFCAGAVALAGMLVTGGWAAETTKDSTKSQTGKVTPAQRPPASKGGGGARGPLPDPVLLDGSTQAAEKKTDYGMIGDFELPGDENAKTGKVGGPPGGGQQNPNQQNQGAGGMPMGMPQGGGAAGPQSPQQQAGQAGQQAGGPQQQNADASKQGGGANDPNAKAEGIQVAQLGGEGSGDQQLPPGEKPPPVAIGDSAMRIQTSANAPGVVGGQQLPSQNTQQHDKGTGSGGKGPTGTQGPGRVEKGRTIPAGL